MKDIMNLDIDINMDFKFKVVLYILGFLIIVYQWFTKLLKYIGQFFKFMVRIYKLYIYIILFLPVFLPIHIMENDFHYQFPPYVVIYDLVLLLGGVFYIARITEMKERKDWQEWQSNFENNSKYKVDLRENNRNYWNNSNSYRSRDRFSKKEILEKKKNIRKILEKKELI
jgi:hypothetical protein